MYFVKQSFPCTVSNSQRLVESYRKNPRQRDHFAKQCISPSRDEASHDVPEVLLKLLHIQLWLQIALKPAVCATAWATFEETLHRRENQTEPCCPSLTSGWWPRTDLHDEQRERELEAKRWKEKTKTRKVRNRSFDGLRIRHILVKCVYLQRKLRSRTGLTSFSRAIKNSKPFEREKKRFSYSSRHSPSRAKDVDTSKGVATTRNSSGSCVINFTVILPSSRSWKSSSNSIASTYPSSGRIMVPVVKREITFSFFFLFFHNP